STAPACLTETEAWGARRSRGETVDRVTSVLAPLIGQLGYRMAIEGRLTDALGVDANYVRRSGAGDSGKGRTIAPAPEAAVRGSGGFLVQISTGSRTFRLRRDRVGVSYGCACDRGVGFCFCGWLRSDRFGLDCKEQPVRNLAHRHRKKTLTR